MRLHQLLPNLYVSNFPDAKGLAKENFDTVLTVCKKPLPENLRILAYVSIHIPLTDGNKLPDDLTRAVSTVVASCVNGNKTLVHCYLGKNRSWLVATHAYSELTKTPIREAFRFVRETYPGAIRNKVFEEHFK